ncbi:MAG: hypothetical protein RBT15_03445 [Gudongella sp.]|nr:hypothetical protein [Gudongella sp.]
MLELLITIVALLLFTSLLGFFLTVMKEKYYLKNNVILIDNKHVSQDDLDDTDAQEFILDGTKLTAGDEISIITKEREIFKGVLIGAMHNEQSIKLVTYANEVIKLKIESIRQLKIMSKYGKFFS